MRATTAAAALAALSIAGCGANKTTITKTVTTTVTRTVRAMTRPPHVLIENLFGVQSWVAEPKKLDFSVDGDFSATGLHWASWGGSMTAAVGELEWRDYPSQNYSSAIGLVVLTRIVECNHKRYYSSAEAEAPGLPTIYQHELGPTTPCAA
jgi:hypothetical protein